jgi:tetratricopeptide (TPR) repeat protein
MGTIYEAWDDARGVPVALKTWRAVGEGDHKRSERLLREAQALSKVHSPAVVGYVDHGTAPECGGYLVLEWVPGETLSERFATSGVTPADAVRLIRRLAEGLGVLHAHSIVHRDLKPANVMLPDADVATAIIVDLGIARLGGESDLTRTGTNLGTPRYMAPEQIRSARTVDGRADVFALGCILMEALTGRPAFDGDDPVAVLSRILFEPAPLPTARRPELPHAFDDLVRSMLAREPTFRPSASAVIRLLDDALAATQEAFSVLPPIALGAARDSISGGSTQPDDDGFAAGGPPSFRVAEGSARAKARTVLARGRGPLFGRTDEVTRLSALLAAGTRLVSVWGGPGVGKTRLVDEVVASLVERPRPPWDVFVHGDLSDAADADDVVRILAREAGVSLEPGHAPEVALGRALSRLGRVLLVADPVDLVATSFVASLRAWKSVAPDLTVIAVSRARWKAKDAAQLEVAPLATAAEPGSWSPAAELFVARVAELLPGAVPARDDTEQRDRVQRVVELTAGVPLAIELCAARVPVLGVAGLLERASRDGTLPLLEIGEGAMRRAVSSSWELLSPAEQRALVHCAVFRGGFDAAACDAVLGDGAAAAPLEAVQSLREKSLLVSAATADGAVRLSMLPAVREFAVERLDESPDRGDVLARHAAHFAASFYPPRAVDALSLSRLEREAENLLVAAEAVVSGETSDTAPGLSCLVALEPAMLARGALGSFRALLDRAVDDAVDRDTDAVGALRARARQIRARLDATAGETARARSDLAVCLDAARRASDSHFEATVWVDLGVAFHLERALPDAKRCYETAVTLLEPLDDLRTEGRAIGNLGALSHDEGALAEAAAAYRNAIALLEEAGEAAWRANFTANLALVEQELGHLEEARRLYERAVALLEPIRNARLLAIALGNFGVLELELGVPAPALAAFERCRALLTGSGDLRSEAICQGRIAAALALLGRADEAEARVHRAERLARRASDPLAAEAVALVRGLVHLARAQHAVDSEDRAAARVFVENVKRLVGHAHQAVVANRLLRDQSDDVRATLRITETTLARVEAALES